jgi:type II secretory pathway pseudopilin PulG
MARLSPAGEAAVRLPGCRQQGFTYLWVLLAVAVLGTGLSSVAQLWEAEARRQRNEQLEWVGAQYRQAIGSYYESAGAMGRTFPKDFDDLLEDRRLGVVRRHLRTVYRNPMTDKIDWEPIKGSDGRIRGVRVFTDSAKRSVRSFEYVPSS